MADGNLYYGQHFVYIQQKLFEQNSITNLGNEMFTPKNANIPIPTESTVCRRTRQRRSRSAREGSELIIISPKEAHHWILSPFHYPNKISKAVGPSPNPSTLYTPSRNI